MKIIFCWPQNEEDFKNLAVHGASSDKESTDQDQRNKTLIKHEDEKNGFNVSNTTQPTSSDQTDTVELVSKSDQSSEELEQNIEQFSKADDFENNIEKVKNVEKGLLQKDKNIVHLNKTVPKYSDWSKFSIKLQSSFSLDSVERLAKRTLSVSEKDHFSALIAEGRDQEVYSELLGDLFQPGAARQLSRAWHCDQCPDQTFRGTGVMFEQHFSSHQERVIIKVLRCAIFNLLPILYQIQSIVAIVLTWHLPGPDKSDQMWNLWTQTQTEEERTYQNF